MGKRRTQPPGDRKFHAPKAKRILLEAPGAAGSAMPIPSQSSDPNEDPAGMDTDPQASEHSSAKADPDRILVGEAGPGSPQKGRDKEIGSSRALGSPKQGISKGIEENHLELPQLGILEVDRTGKDELESPNLGILVGAGVNCPESPKPAVLEVDGAGEEAPESVKHEILDGMGQNHLESSQLGILEEDGAGEKQLESPQMRIPEADGAGEEQLESVKLEILDGTGEEQLESVKLEILDGTGGEQLESSKPGISEVVGAAEEQLETPTHRISNGAEEEHPESVKPGIPEADGEREEQLEPLKQGIWYGAGENQLESPKPGASAAHSPEDTVTHPDPAESSEGLNEAGEGEEGALEEGCGTGTAPSTDTGSLGHPRDPQSGGGDAESRNSQSGNSTTATPGLDPAATSTQPQDQREGTSPELPTEKPYPDGAGQQPWDTVGQTHAGSKGNSPAQPWESSARATEPADASDIIHGLIRELSDLNRLAMGARRGLELLRRPKPRRGRRPVPSGSHWKEG